MDQIMQNPLRGSEFWAMVAVLVLEAGVGRGWWSQADIQDFVNTFLTYAGLRITSKVAKAVPSPNKEAK